MAKDKVAALLQIEQQIRRSESPEELYYTIVNETRQLMDYEQAVLLLGSDVGSLKIAAISDTPLIDRTSPFVRWLEKVLKRKDSDSEQREANGEVHCIDQAQWSEQDIKALSEYSPPNMVWLPLMLPSRPNERLGVLWMASVEKQDPRALSMLPHIAGSYAHGLTVFSRTGVITSLRKKLFRKGVMLSVMALVLAAMFIPVRLSVLAPSEVASQNPVVVTSPLRGAVESVLVTPGQNVALGTPLVQLDKTELQGSADVSQRAFDRAKAELRTAEQAGFADQRSKSQISELRAEVEIKNAELAFAQNRLEKSLITADSKGLVIVDDINDWKGKPVNVGERIMQLANPDQVQLRVMLPVSDAIALDEGAEVVFFLDTDPLNPLDASLKYSAYEPELTPEDVMAYKVIADFIALDDQNTPRIGLRGTAKIYGEKVTLFYYLFRRPLTTARQWLGW